MTAGGEAAIDAVRDRVGATLESARHIELERLIIGRSGPDVDAARRVALAAAASAGRSELVHQAREAALDWATRSFSERAYSGTWALTEMSMSVTRPADRVAVAEALADAVTADVVEDLVDVEVVDALRARWDTIETAGPMPEPGSLSGLTSAISTGEGWIRSSLVAAFLFLIIGGMGFLGGNLLGIGFLVAGVFVLKNALRGRSV